MVTGSPCTYETGLGRWTHVLGINGVTIGVCWVDIGHDTAHYVMSDFGR